MTRKQYKKADSMVVPVVLVVMLGTFLNMLGMLGTGQGNVFIKFVTGVSIVGIIAAIGIYVKLRGTRKCGILLSILATIVWGVMVVFVDAQFFYMLAAPIFVAQMAYLEKKRILISTLVIFPIFTIKSLLLSKNGIVSTTEAGTSIVLLVLTIVSVYCITKI